MLMVLSPSKTLDMTPEPIPLPASTPALLDDTILLAEAARMLSVKQLGTLMAISEKLGQLTHERFAAFAVPYPEGEAKPALYAFKGDVYEPMAIASYDAADLTFADRHLRILSGLYGVLRPLDRMMAYRLEMGVDLKNPRGRDLYAFWGDLVTEQLNLAIKESGSLVVNLASQEYFRAVRPGKLAGKVLHVHFKEQRGEGDEPKVIALFTKKARGMMADFVIRHRIDRVEGLKAFGEQDYRFAPELSDGDNLTFLRRH